MKRADLGWVILGVAAAAVWVGALGYGGWAAGSAPRPIRALLVTGGCCHDYEAQKKIITEGISARANVTWTIVHEGGDSREHQVSIYKKPGWAAGYDVVVHSECFGAVNDPAFLEGIVAPHKAGVPGVVLHCSMHSYRASPNADEWREFLGVTTTSHEGHRPLDVTVLNAAHPIMQGFPPLWKTPNGELYKIERLGPQATPLAKAWGVETQKEHVCVWTNLYGKTRVFGTTLGHHNETVSHEIYLNLVARGLLWAVEKLDDQGNPSPGYGPAGKP